MKGADVARLLRSMLGVLGSSDRRRQGTPPAEDSFAARTSPSNTLRLGFSVWGFRVSGLGFRV